MSESHTTINRYILKIKIKIVDWIAEIDEEKRRRRRLPRKKEDKE